MYGLKCCQSIVIIIEIKVKFAIILTKGIFTDLVKGAENLDPLVSGQTKIVLRALVNLPGLEGVDIPREAGSGFLSNGQSSQGHTLLNQIHVVCHWNPNQILCARIQNILLEIVTKKLELQVVIKPHKSQLQKYGHFAKLLVDIDYFCDFNPGLDFKIVISYFL